MKKLIIVVLCLVSLISCDAPINENRKHLLEANHSENIKRQIVKKTIQSESKAKSKGKSRHSLYVEGNIYDLEPGKSAIFYDIQHRTIETNRLENSTLIICLALKFHQWNNIIIVDDIVYQGEDYLSLCPTILTGDVSGLKKLEGYKLKISEKDRLILMKGEDIIVNSTEIIRTSQKPYCIIHQ